MSLKLKGIKTIANKLKQTKRDKEAEQKTTEFEFVVSPPGSPGLSPKLLDVSHSSVRTASKVYPNG